MNGCHSNVEEELVHHTHSAGDLEAIQTQGVAPSPEQVLVGELYSLVHKDALGSKVSLTEEGSLRCSKCMVDVGRLKPARNTGLAEKDEKTCEMYHVSARLHGKPVSRKLSSSSNCSPSNNYVGSQESLVASLPKSYIETRFGSVQRYFAWYLLNESDSQSTIKFVIRTLTGEPKILVWLLDSYSILTVGRMNVTGGSSPTSKKSALINGTNLDASDDNIFLADEDQKENGCGVNNNNKSAVANNNKIHAFPVVKLLYKVINETNSDDPRVTGMDWSVGKIFLPERACTDLMETLLASSRVLPPPCRMVGQFYVGYLKINDTL